MRSASTRPSASRAAGPRLSTIRRTSRMADLVSDRTAERVPGARRPAHRRLLGEVGGGVGHSATPVRSGPRPSCSSRRSRRRSSSRATTSRSRETWSSSRRVVACTAVVSGPDGRTSTRSSAGERRCSPARRPTRRVPPGKRKLGGSAVEDAAPSDQLMAVGDDADVGKAECSTDLRRASPAGLTPSNRPTRDPYPQRVAALAVEQLVHCVSPSPRAEGKGEQRDQGGRRRRRRGRPPGRRTQRAPARRAARRSAREPPRAGCRAVGDAAPRQRRQPAAAGW